MYLNRTIKIAGAAAAIAFAGVLEASPARLTSTLPPAGTKTTTGDSVSGNARWGIVFDIATCDLDIYELQYSTDTNANMNWDFSQTVTALLPGFSCGFRYGASSSIAGDVIVAGAPDWDTTGFFGGSQQGAFALYTFNGTTWSRFTGLNNIFGFLQYQPGPQGGGSGANGARFGESVSVSQDPANPDRYLIAVGAPGYDGGNGRVYAYEFDLSGPSISLVGFEEGTGGPALGTAVTTNFPFVLAGAPFDDTLASDAGAGYLYEADFGTPELTIVGSPFGIATASLNLGREVSLGDEFALLAGQDVAYGFENTGTPSSPSYSNPSDPVATFGGDVSQSAGVSAFGLQSNGLGELGATILPNVLTDDVSADEYVSDVSFFITEPPPSLVGEDIRITRESIFYADTAQNQAILNRFPAGFGQKVEAGVFFQQNLPCNVVGLELQEVFGYLGVADENPFDNTFTGAYIAFLFDDTLPALTTGLPYRVLANDYVFTEDDLNYGLFMALAPTLDDQYVPLSQCDGTTPFTTPDFAGAQVQPAPGTFNDNVRAQKRVKLVDFVPGGDVLLMNNPFPRDIFWGDVRYVSPIDESALTPAQAQAGNFISSTVYVYDTGATNSAGQNYRAISTTPGFGGRIKGYESFWVEVLPDGLTSGSLPNSHALLMPQPE